MARARIELVGSNTHNCSFGSFEKNKPRVLVNTKAIDYYKMQGIFKVKILPEEEAKPEEEKAPENTEETSLDIDNDEEEIEEEDFEDDSAEEDSENDDSEDDDSEDEDEEDEPEAPEKHSAASLKRLNKADLIEVGAGMGVELDDANKKVDMIRAILKAQK